MTFKEREKIKKIYDETATLIADLALKQNLSQDEMYFLLNLLDLIVIERKSLPLTQVLHLWLQKDLNPALDEEIKNLLLTSDLKDEKELKKTIDNIRRLLAKY
ncbi:hypothetical protein SAMN02745221_00585 [Thermosyntropha lipolytica DSM 11003]|uniref:Uncharacterized protein n=1 Tax=Thermosyntropha lipolytica DSM 11003 TaxID=1123382 RepID=A0A1M5L7N7_9FIRM|nr:hypothetical protein [Thermosyntropha lipolytica]SHG60976.1 hypothetical protein SAMN02745221_00585 [Thermosyntropha lipolytica DSM 11003]